MAIARTWSPLTLGVAHGAYVAGRDARTRRLFRCCVQGESSWLAAWTLVLSLRMRQLPVIGGNGLEPDATS